MLNSCASQPPFSPPLAMRWLDHTCATPAENLALDHTLLDQADSSSSAAEVLRVWEPAEPFVVLGRSSRWDDEVNEVACKQQGVPVLRRVSGGAAIVTGPGCLMFSALFNLRRRPEMRMIDHAHVRALAVLVAALKPLAPTIRCAGSSDLVVAPGGALVKCSGNSLRVGRNWLLYHGTLMYAFDLGLITACLKEPPRQPGYRERREHHEFITNLPIARGDLIQALRGGFGADHAMEPPVVESIGKLVADKYGNENWTKQR